MAGVRAKKITNVDSKRSDKSDIRKRITVPTEIFRVRQDIQKWRTAVRSAESLTNPMRYSLYQTYQDVVLDAHLSAVIQQRKNLILSKNFVVLGKDGKENEEKTALIRKKWFYDYLNLVLDSKYWAHSLIQFGDIVNDEFKEVDLVPRVHVKPEFNIVVESYAAMTGANYLDEPWKRWCIGVGEKRDLGLLLKAAPLVIWKKNAIGAWAEFVEVFGTPIRIGKTNSRDHVTRSNMEDMLKNMGVASYGLFDLDDEINLIESKRTDAYNVFDKMIERCNSEISKLILGETGTIDEKAHVGAAEVHERMLKQIGFQDELFVRSVNNYQLVPLLNTHGFGMEGMTIDIESEEMFSVENRAKFDVELLKTGRFTFSPEYIKENYGSDVIPVEKETNSIEEVKNRLEKYYK